MPEDKATGVSPGCAFVSALYIIVISPPHPGLGIESRTLQMLGECSATGYIPRPAQDADYN